MSTKQKEYTMGGRLRFPIPQCVITVVITIINHIISTALWQKVEEKTSEKKRTSEER